ASSLPQAPRIELSLRGTRISPGLASGTVWMTGDIPDCSAETHRIEPQQVDAEMERVRLAFAQVTLIGKTQRAGEQIDPSLARCFVARALQWGLGIHWVARWCSGRRSWRKDILIGSGGRRNPTRVTMAPA